VPEKTTNLKAQNCFIKKDHKIYSINIKVFFLENLPSKKECLPAQPGHLTQQPHPVPAIEASGAVLP
jgi:hypothetical protein